MTTLHQSAPSHVAGSAPGGAAAVTNTRHHGLAIYLPSSNNYQDSILPTGTFAGSPQDAL
jgi:hypothetical protein